MNPFVVRRMIAAEFLKLRRRRGLLAWSGLLAVGTIVIYYVWQITNHQPGSPPFGGVDGFEHSLEIVGIFMGPLAAVLIGAEAGAGDHAAGVFRDLVVTGRSRVALFAARVPGALLLNSIVVSLAYATLLVGAVAFAGSGPDPSLGTVLEGYGWALLVDGAVCVVALGMASLMLSRPATITVLIGFELVASPVLMQQSSLGSARTALLDASVLKLAPALSHGAPVLAESIGLTVAVLVAWVGIAAGLGAWRTARLDA